MLIFWARPKIFHNVLRRECTCYNKSTLLRTCVFEYWVQNCHVYICVEKHLRQNYTLWNLNFVVLLNFTLLCTIYYYERACLCVNVWVSVCRKGKHCEVRFYVLLTHVELRKCWMPLGMRKMNERQEWVVKYYV